MLGLDLRFVVVSLDVAVVAGGDGLELPELDLDDDGPRLLFLFFFACRRGMAM